MSPNSCAKSHQFYNTTETRILLCYMGPSPKDIANLDNVQKFAGRTVTRNWSMNLTELQLNLNWQPLKTRRRNIKLRVVYNIVNKLSRIPLAVFVQHPSPSPRHPHNKILLQPYVSTLSHRYSFFVDVIPLWNSLSSSIVNSPSPYAFKTRLRNPLHSL